MPGSLSGVIISGKKHVCACRRFFRGLQKRRGSFKLEGAVALHLE